FEAALQTTGSYNTVLGSTALYTNTTGTYLTAVGYNASVTATNYTNTTLIGNGASGTASNQVRLGNTSVSSIGGYVGWTNISDGRYKKNIKENVPGLAFIDQLHPLSYTLDIIGLNQFIHSQEAKLTTDPR